MNVNNGTRRLNLLNMSTTFQVESTAGDSLAPHNGMEFTTYDQDNDLDPSLNCAVDFKGGWWYNGCHPSNPTGLYLQGGVHSWEGIVWETAYDSQLSFKYMEMKLIPKPTCG